MRDTFIIIAVLAGITFGYFQLRRTASAPQTQTLASHNKGKNRTSGRASSKHRNQGDRDERSTIEQAISSEASGTQEGDSGEVAEAQGITSIYSQSSETKKSPRVVAKKASSKNRSAIGGFDAASYLANRKTKFHQYPVAGPTDEGLRVYLMCMEVRGSNLESKSASDCRALYKDNIAARNSGNSSTRDF